MRDAIRRGAGGPGRRVLVVVVLAGLLSGCQLLAGLGVAPGQDLQRLHAQAQAALDRYATAVAQSDGGHGVELVGELTGQVGDWEEAVGGNNKPALMAGLVEVAGQLPTTFTADATVRWPDGPTQTVPVISAAQAVEAIRTGGAGPCPECTALRITAARLTSGPLQTSRGPATGPVWEFTVQGTAVRVTRVAIDHPVVVVPPAWNSSDPPIGLAIESARGTAASRVLTVTFVGAPDPGSEPCGADYTAEAVESDLAVAVIVLEHPHGGFGACASVGAYRTAAVELAAPLGDRAVLEVQQGLPVPVTEAP